MEANNRAQCNSILIIEDDEGIRSSLKLALEFDGYNVFTAENGQIGLDILPQIPRPCLILLDLMMPVMNGWSFVEVLEKDVVLATVPVVIVSAYIDQAKMVKSKGVIKKPIDLNILYQIVNKWCPRNAITP